MFNAVSYIQGSKNGCIAQKNEPAPFRKIDIATIPGDGREPAIVIGRSPKLPHFEEDYRYAQPDNLYFIHPSISVTHARIYKSALSTGRPCLLLDDSSRHGTAILRNKTGQLIIVKPGYPEVLYSGDLIGLVVSEDVEDLSPDWYGNLYNFFKHSRIHFVVASDYSSKIYAIRYNATRILKAIKMVKSDSSAQLTQLLGSFLPVPDDGDATIAEATFLHEFHNLIQSFGDIPEGDIPIAFELTPEAEKEKEEDDDEEQPEEEQSNYEEKEDHEESATVPTEDLFCSEDDCVCQVNEVGSSESSDYDIPAIPNGDIPESSDWDASESNEDILESDDDLNSDSSIAATDSDDSEDECDLCRKRKFEEDDNESCEERPETKLAVRKKRRTQSSSLEELESARIGLEGVRDGEQSFETVDDIIESLKVVEKNLKSAHEGRSKYGTIKAALLGVSFGAIAMFGTLAHIGANRME
ncbi:DEKNAAC101190 [Brettanomyces naardenensis]|uniref:DEKNAAC101190 n=1 Tax=Brettanomyces naardenensis TaxID=13370 RepID=A0A448YH94_BRENA|nr:DEKNAAC101190 [Brettanomyces naardenensis]